MNFHPGAQRLVARTLAEAIRPVPPTPFRAWLPQNLVLVDGPKKGEFWAEADAPYLGEIADCLDVDHPANLVTVRKSQQTGVSILALGWSLYLADVAPDNILYGVPGKDALEDMNSKKLQPLIDEWQRKSRKRVIYPTISRSGGGSSTFEKKFDGGALSLANANVVMELSGNTSRFGVKDEFSKWQNTSNGDDPDILFFGRFTAFRRLKSYKIFEFSTPEIDSGDPLGDEPGHCRIDRSFQRSDKRYWNIQCPECAHKGNWFFQSEAGFAIDRAHPHKSYYECPFCGHHISELERIPAVRAGRYVATDPDVIDHPGFHVDAFVSLMMSYEAMAEDWLEQQKQGEEGAKNYTNLILALPYAQKGNAPDWQRLMERREDIDQGVVPEQGLIVTAGADVHHDNIIVEVVAFAEDRQTWSITVEHLDGPTDNVNEGAWLKLEEVLRREFVDAFGQARCIEALAVDSGDGLRATQVYSWCAGRPNAYAIKGRHGRGVPAIGQPSKVSIRKSGKRARIGSAKVWPVGTWALKGELMSNLHKIGMSAGEIADPPGYCHFGKWHDEEYFKQLTAEVVVRRMVKGKLFEEWQKLRRANHWLDARIYAMAMAELLGLSKLTRDGWAALRARIIPSMPLDLLTPPPLVLADVAPGVSNVPKQTMPAAPAQTSTGWKRRR